MNFHSKLQKIWESNFHLPSMLKHAEFDELVFQFPAYSFYLMKRFVRSFHKYHANSKLIFLVHDVESLRQNANGKYDKDEVAVLNSADGLIVHNDRMKKYLSDIGVNVPMVCLHIFDYDNPQPLVTNDKFNKDVCFAGNLAKAEFLTKVSDEVRLNVYGPNPASNYPKSVKYLGVYTPEELPAHLKGDFGLVWDGTTVDGCDGIYGNYLKYNAPHKVSLYLSTGLPVIVWKESAMADYIESNNLGFSVNSLTEIPQLLDTISDDIYSSIKSNVDCIAEKLRRGSNIKSAVLAIEKLIH